MIVLGRLVVHERARHDDVDPTKPVKKLDLETQVGELLEKVVDNIGRALAAVTRDDVFLNFVTGGTSDNTKGGITDACFELPSGEVLCLGELKRPTVEFLVRLVRAGGLVAHPAAVYNLLTAPKGESGALDNFQ